MGQNDSTFWAISIPTLREEGDVVEQEYRVSLLISIPTLREEGDIQSGSISSRADRISIPTLREEGDGLAVFSPYSPANFYPHPPRGGRPPRASCS